MNIVRWNSKDHYAFKGNFIVDEKKGHLVFINEQSLKNQSKVMGFLIKEIGRSIFTGKSVFDMKLPVFIFDKKSYQEGFIGSLSYASYYLEK